MKEIKFDDRLLKILEKEVFKEKWKKKIRIIGIVNGKRITKRGSFVLNVKTPKSEYEIVIPQYKKELFNLAEEISAGCLIKITGDRQAGGIIFCDKIEVLKKENGHQTKLLIK